MKRILLTILTYFVVLSVNADSWMNYSSNYTEGTEFYVTYMHANTQAGVTDLDIALFMAARQPAVVTISDAFTNQTIATLNIPATNVNNSYCMWSASQSNPPLWFQVQDYYCTVSNTVYPKSIHVTSTSDISLYMANSAASSSDASLVMPSNRLGKEYVVQTPTNNAEASEFAIVAVNDQTTVYINPSVSVANPGGATIPAGSVIQETLNKGEVYFLAASSVALDLSGTTICADKDVMVFNGSQSMRTPSSVQGHVCHQTTPIHTWGKKFALVRMMPQDYNQIKITALDDTTVINLNFGNNQVLSYTLNPFASRLIPWTKMYGNAVYVTASRPVVCFQYMLARADQSGTGRFDSDTGEEIKIAGGLPSSTIITPISQGVNSVMFGAFQDAVRQLTYCVNIVCPTSAIDSMKLDGIRIPSSQFSVMPGLSGYSYVSKQITDSAHSLTNSKGAFTALTYGMTSPTATEDWSYAYNVGMNCQHEDAYLLIDGVRTNSASKCQNNDNQWIWNFKGVINVDYDSIEWFYDKGKFGSGDSLRHTFNQLDSFEHPIFMVVHRTTPICQTAVVDTVMAQINNAMTYNKIRAIEYHCRNDHDTIVAFPGTVYEKKILADTVPLNITRTVIQLFETQSGCDSIVHFKYQVRNPQNVSITQHICQGSSFTYQGQELTEAGAYPFDEVDEGGCHYTKTIKIIVDPTYDIHIYDTVCDVDLPYLWRHSAADIDTLTQTTPDFVRNFKTKHQCDSIVHLHLIVGQSYLFPENESVCDNELPYIWRGKSLKKAGIFYDSLLTQHGCDSVYSFKLRVLPTYKEKDTAYICDNETYLWRGNMYSSAGLYWDSLKTVNGCDSIFSLLLMVYPSYHYQEQQEVCKKRSIVWRGKTIKAPQSGVFNYFDSLESRLGCDSVYELTLTVHPVYNIEVKRTICQGETYEFAGETERTWQNNVVGNHRDTALFKTVYGCDSVLILNLTVNPVYHFDTVGVTCTNVPFHWVQGDLDEYINQTTSGTEEYYRTYTTAAGCDSTYHLTLTSNNTLVVQRTVTISDRDSVIWEGKVYAGTKYTATTPDSIITTLNTPLTIEHLYESETTGCDSVVRLVITVCPTYELEDHVTTCQYEVYSILGRSSWTWQKDVVGDHDTLYIYKTVQGFDSLMHLYLTVYPIYNFSDTLHTCSNSDFIWTGHKHIGYNVPGTYTYYDNYKTVNGCDSVFRLCLIVEDTMLVHVNHVMCDIDTFTWDGTMFAGNKSVYATVADSVLLPDTYNCRRTYRSATGCDSFITLTLTVNQTYEFYDTVETCQDNPYHPNGGDPTYWTLHKDTAGVYDDTFRYQTVNGCDSVRHLHLTVHPEYSFEETLYTCCNDEFVWPGHESIAIGQRPVGSYTYRDSLTTENHGCDSVHILHLIVQDTIINPTVHTMCDIDTFTWDGTMFAG
ncbi:MAG: IgGFc-binding protein, partial [bacterium]|nr:IgGFc-binding protein [Candidatus Colousia faecequi]